MVRPREGSIPVREAERKLRGPAAGLPALMLAAGADDFLRERLVRACRAGAEAEGAEFQRLEGDSLDAETLAGALATLALFGGAQRIWIREGSKMGSAVEGAVLAWAEAPGEGAFVLVTTARDVEELRFLQTLSARAATTSCSLQGRDAAEWARTIAQEEGLKLPPRTAEAILESSPDLMSYRQEIRKLAAHADAEGGVPASALDVLRKALADASVDRWAVAALAGSGPAVRAETEALAREGIGGTSALWAIAERALGALEPQGFLYRRPAAGERPALGPEQARAVLHAVYRADRALKRGDIRDSELAETLVSSVRHAILG